MKKYHWLILGVAIFLVPIGMIAAIKSRPELNTAPIGAWLSACINNGTKNNPATWAKEGNNVIIYIDSKNTEGFPQEVLNTNKSVNVIIKRKEDYGK